MRLICPNCGAQYEVPEEVIPTSGRDVQCSDCGTTWFQHHPDHEPEVEEEETSPPSDWQEEPEVETPDEDMEVTMSEADAEPVHDSGDLTEVDDSPFQDDEDSDDDAPSQDGGAFSRKLDPSVAEVLREEAELETSARVSDQASGLETQQELGLDSQRSADEQRTQEARNRMARLRGDEITEEYEEDIEAELEDRASRRNLLPDIDEINSSLGPDNSANAAVSAMESSAEVAVPKNSFRTGFRVAVFVAILALVIYIFAPQLAEAVPALSEPLGQYKSMIDGWRMALDGIVSDFAYSLSDE